MALSIGNFHKELAEICAFQKPNKGLRCVLKPVDDVFLILELTFADRSRSENRGPGQSIRRRQGSRQTRESGACHASPARNLDWRRAWDFDKAGERGAGR